MLFKVFIIIIIILFIFHYVKYKKNNDEYEIIQQELEYINGNELYDNLNPLVITFIEDNTLKYNIEKYHLYSPISINFNFFNLNTNSYYLRHTNEILLIRCKKDLTIELINNKYSKYFSKVNKSFFLENYSLDENNFSNVQSIDILIHEYNILLVPRFWFFRCTNSDISIEIFKCDNIFTKVFNIVKL